MSEWVADVLGEGYLHRTLALGDDPDDEGEIVATLVKADPPPEAHHAFLWVHGFSDYFFQTELAEFMTVRGYAFYALDLRKCGRSRRPGQTPHFTSDLRHYDAELNRSLAIVEEETRGLPVVLGAHSTGGLVLSLWLHRMRSTGGSHAGSVDGLVLDSPWFDLQGAPWMRSIGTQAVRGVAHVKPYRKLNLPKTSVYGKSLHKDFGGEWDYDLEWKPLGGCAVTYGWLNAIRRGHARLHRGLDVGVPSLVLRSDKTWFGSRRLPQADISDVVLDARQIGRWVGCLGGAVTSLPIADARHDVFLSRQPAREAAYAAVDRWLDSWIPR
ncbi:MAG: alpha/beta hydrolase [Aeromicrobium sp.]|uniref:alpha/beta hydrolase n=1 Tax=Aeromicrobium sp. TaxID=1871063 RepID=UPI0039E2BF90